MANTNKRWFQSLFPSLCEKETELSMLKETRKIDVSITEEERKDFARAKEFFFPNATVMDRNFSDTVKKCVQYTLKNIEMLSK